MTVYYLCNGYGIICVGPCTRPRAYVKITEKPEGEYKGPTLMYSLKLGVVYTRAFYPVSVLAQGEYNSKWNGGGTL